MELDNLIFDRTQSDVSRVQSLTQKMIAGTATEAEKEEWLGGSMKGSYNASDLNRVIAAMDYLNEYFLGLGYDVGYTKIRVPHFVEGGGGGGNLPDEYTQVSYIQSSGPQYIDTGFKPNQDTRVVMDFDLLSVNGKYADAIFGTRTSISSQAYYFWASGSDSEQFQSGYNDSALYPQITRVGRHLVDKNKNITTVDNVTVEHEYADFTTVDNMLLFNSYDNGKLRELSTNMKLYSCQIYDNESIIRDYVPCIAPTGDVGLYDIVNNQFYANAGSSSFIGGSEIDPPPEPEPEPEPPKDEFLWYEDDIPTKNIMETYISDVQKFRSKIPYPPGTSDTPPDMELLTYQEANDIEKILYTLESVLIAMEEAFLLRQANTLFMIAGGVFNNA